MTSFWMALSMFSILPAPFVWDEKKKQEMLLYFPLVGLLIGILWALAALLLSLTELQYLSAAVLTVLPWLLSGFIHLDGFVDCSDAYLSRASHEKKLQILKDSRVGAFALIAMVLLALLSFAALLDIQISEMWLLFMFIPFVSRASAAAAVLNLPAMAGSSYEALTKGGVKKSYQALPFVMLLGAMLIAFLLLGRYGAALALEAAVSLSVILRLRKEFGGMSGDISGCSIVLSEFAAVLGAAILGGIGL